MPIDAISRFTTPEGIGDGAKIRALEPLEDAYIP